MLATESSPPDGDLLCHQLSPPLLKSSRGDERATGDDKVALQEQVDLLIKSGSLPKFSIRDYVYRVRNKDIKTNWPFSQRTLRVCLKHGVKNPLPPFQPHPSIRKYQSSIKESSYLEQDANANNLKGKKPPSDSHALLSTTTTNASLSNPATVPAVHLVSSNTNKYALLCSPEAVASEIPREKELAPAVAAIHSQSEAVESSSVPYNKLSSSIAETPSLLEASVSPPSPPRKGKKCKLIFKLGSSSADPAEDTASNCSTALPEAMASKVCPVCRTFSSSSNTTLNAHIDQCLSVESTSQWVPEPNLNRHRIKPRKMRLMTDICATAPPCTLEELDRRNGSSWAAVDHSILPTRQPEAEACHKEKRHRTLPIYPGKNNDDDAGAVYIDANGTKLRILVKLNDAPSALRVGENPELGKTLKKSERSKIISTKKKKDHLQQHHKYLKVAPEGIQPGSLNASKFKIHMAREGNSVEKGIQEKKQDQTQCFKRSGLSKKGNEMDIHQISGCKFHAAQNLLVESNQSCHGDSCAERSCVEKSPSSSETPISTPGSCQGIQNPRREARVNSNREHSRIRKRGGCPLSKAQMISDHVGKPFGSVMKKVNSSSKDNFPVHGSCILKRQRFNHTSSLSYKTGENQAGPFKKSKNSSQCDEKSSWSCHESLSESLRFTGLTKKHLSATRSSVVESKSKVNIRHLTSTKPQVQIKGQIDEEVVAGSSKVERQYDLVCNYNRNESSAEYKRKSIAESSFGHGDELLFEDEVGSSINAQNTCLGAELEPELGQANSFPEVEPISIPGPPGSYLPSPQGMSSNDLQGNSSLPTSRIQSSHDQKELVDGDSSDSPISGTSTISNPDVARSDLNYSEKALSSGPHQVQDLVSSGFLGASIEPATEHNGPVPQAMSFGVKRTFPEGDDLVANEIIPEKGYPTFKDHHICCCSRKGRISPSVELNYEDSPLLRRRAMSMEKQMGFPPNSRISNANGSPEIFSFSDCTSPGLGKVPVMKSPTKPTHMKLSSDDAAVKFPNCGDVDTACPSASNPILRLMGKNLMVVNKDEDVPTRCRQPRPVVSNKCPSGQLSTCSMVSPPNNQNQEYHPFYQAVARSSDMFNHNLHNQRECIENRFSKDSRSCMNFKMPQTPQRAPAGMFLSNDMEENYMERVPNLQSRETCSSGISCKDIIDDTNCTEGSRGSPLIALGISSTPVTVDNKSAYIGSFTQNQSVYPPPSRTNCKPFSATFF